MDADTLIKQKLNQARMGFDTDIRFTIDFCKNHSDLVKGFVIGVAIAGVLNCSENNFRGLFRKQKQKPRDPRREYRLHLDLVKSSNKQMQIPLTFPTLKRLLKEKKDYLMQSEQYESVRMPLFKRLFRWAKSNIFGKPKTVFEKRVEEYEKLQESLPWFVYATGIQGSPYFIPQEVALHITGFTGYKKEFYVTPKEIITELLPYCRSLFFPEGCSKIDETKGCQPTINRGFSYKGKIRIITDYCCKFDEFICDINRLNLHYHIQQPDQKSKIPFYRVLDVPDQHLKARERSQVIKYLQNKCGYTG